MNVLRSLAIAEGDTNQTELQESKEPIETPATTDDSNEINYKSLIIEYIQQNSSSNGTDFESIVSHCINNKGERETSEITIENMVEDGELFEVKFGWYKLVT